jgi:hypothetical protein
VIWQVDGGPGESDRTIKFGEAPASEDGFRLHFEDSLPATLLNQRAYGVGLLVLVPESTTLADGSPASGPVAVPLGSAARHAIIYRAAEMPAGPAPAWTAEFPLGFSCAASRKPSGGGFEVFSPTPCGAVELDEGPLRFPNWM